MPRAWWRMRAAAISVVVAATAGCTAGVKTHSAQPAHPSAAATSSASRSPVPQEAVVGDPNGVLVPAPIPPRPHCPALVRYSAGNAGPLFCTDGKDNPAALRYFMRLHLKIMQLPADAHQSQAITAICTDLQHVSEKAEYSAYLLAANREHWYFVGIAKMHGNLRRLCRPSIPTASPTATPTMTPLPGTT